MSELVNVHEPRELALPDGTEETSHTKLTNLWWPFLHFSRHVLNPATTRFSMVDPSFKFFFFLLPHPSSASNATTTTTVEVTTERFPLLSLEWPQFDILSTVQNIYQKWEEESVHARLWFDTPLPISMIWFIKIFSLFFPLLRLCFGWCSVCLGCQTFLRHPKSILYSHFASRDNTISLYSFLYSLSRVYSSNHSSPSFWIASESTKLKNCVY